MKRKSKIKGMGNVSSEAKLVLPHAILVDLHHFTNRRVWITIEDAAETRSLDQNAYYWAAIVKSITDKFNDLGERLDDKDVHEILKYKFLRVIVPDETTLEIKYEYVQSTATLKTYEFYFYCEDCIRYAAQSLMLTIDPPESKRQEYIFPIFYNSKDTRQKYLQRISLYVSDILNIEHLKRFFRQNPDWKNDIEVKAIFTKRKSEILNL